MTAAEKLIAIAEAEVGYLEKASNKQLDDKTANAGDKNYTKYARDLYPSLQGQAWCDMFVDWCFVQAFGNGPAKQLLCGDSGWGHCVYIHAIIDGEVFFMDNWTYRGSSLVKYQPVRMSVSTFNQYQTVEQNLV